MVKCFLILTLAAVVQMPLTAQQKEADAVIVRNDASFTVKDKTHAIYRQTVEMRLTENGGKYGVFSCSVNNGSTRLKSFSGEIKDARGKVRKIKKSDLVYSEYSEGLADSYGTWLYAPTIISYPATVTYTFEKEYTDAVLGYDPFVPLPYTSGVSLTEASYTLTVPAGTRFAYKQLNMDGVQPERSSSNETETYVWRSGEMPAFRKEPDSPPMFTRVSSVLFVPEEFSYDGIEGSAADWKAIGDWLVSLTEGRDTPPEDLKAKVLQLTEGASDDMEKIRRIYEYLGSTTRYVSIQLGLGGLRPIEPEKVFRNKFGDCKALSFYMKTMLKCAGIESDYVIINAGEDKMMPDFPSLGTANHAILAVPCAKDTLWLECTNPDVPLGYVHSRIAGNHALIVKKGASYITRLPSTPDTANTHSQECLVDLSSDGSAMVLTSEKATMDFWPDMYSLSKLTEEKRINSIMSDIVLPRVRISDLKMDFDRTSRPSCHMTYKVEALPYASASGSRMFVPVNPFRSLEGKPNVSRRVNDFYFKDGNVLTDKIVIDLPEGYSIEAGPEERWFENEFGSVSFGLSIAQTDARTRVTLSFRLESRSGTFPKSSGEEYKRLSEEIADIYGAKLVLVKK